MTKFKLLAACGLAVVLAAGAEAKPAAPAAAAVKTDLRTDPALRTGTLPNGMRYQILKNATPAHNASLRLRIDVGSMYESEEERGPDTNAMTTFQQTVYMLDLPETDKETVDTALFLLREVAGEASFTPSAIESERGIVLSEERTRATPQLRNAEDELGYLLKGDVLPTRLPIGSTDVLKTAPRERFVKFYDAYYRPERATLIAVGDFDVDEMEAKIRSQFGTWKGRGKAGPELPAAKIASRAAETHVFSEAGIPNRVALSWVTAPDLRPDTSAVRSEKLVEQLGLQILNRRLSRIASGENPPFIGAGTGRQDQAERAEITQVVAVAQPGKWQPALASIEQEQRRAVQFGFSQAELDREIAEIRARLVAAVAGAATRPTPALAQALVGNVDEDEVFTTPTDDLALFDQVVKGLTAEKVSAATRSLFTAGGPLVYLTSPTPVEGGEATLLSAYQASHSAAVAAGAVQQAQNWPYQSFGTPGAVAERRELAALGATAIRFANGVRLTVKPTKFRTDEILVSARSLGGQALVPADRPSPVWALSSGAFTLGGLGKMSFEDVQQALTSKVYAANFGVDEDAFVLSGKTRPEDLATQLQLLTAFAADPGFAPTGWERLRALSGTIHDQLASTPGGVLGRDAGALLHAGDRRWAMPTREEMAASTVADAKALLAGPLKTGPIEIVMVGDISVDEAVRQVAATFGALPARQDAALPAAALKTAFPAGTLVRETHQGRADQGLAMIAWPTTDFYADMKQARALNLLGQVLQLRLIDEIREKQGTTYSPNAGHSPSETFKGYGYMAAQIEAPPEKLDGFLADAAKIAADLRDTPIGADELQRAKKPLVENLMRQRLGNEWWLSQLADVQTRPEVGASIEQAQAQYEALTAADLQAVARRYLVDAKAWKLEILPEKK